MLSCLCNSALVCQQQPHLCLHWSRPSHSVCFPACNSFLSQTSPSPNPDQTCPLQHFGKVTIFWPISCSFERTTKIQVLCFSFIPHHAQAAWSCSWSPPCLLTSVTHTHLYMYILQCLTIYRCLKDTTFTEYIHAKFPFFTDHIPVCLHLLIVFILQVIFILFCFYSVFILTFSLILQEPKCLIFLVLRSMNDICHFSLFSLSHWYNSVTCSLL